MHRVQGEVNVFVRSCILDQKTVSGHCAKFLIFHRCCTCLCAYISDGNCKLLLRLKKHETSVNNAVEDKNSDSLITEFISFFMLPTWFLGD